MLDAEHKITQPEDVVAVRAAAEAIGYAPRRYRNRLDACLADLVKPPGRLTRRH